MTLRLDVRAGLAKLVFWGLRRPAHSATGDKSLMARDFYANRARVARFATDFCWRSLYVRAMAHPLFRWRAVGVPVPTRLLFAPHDLRTGDPTRASEFYSGRFAFAGKVITTDGASPFEVEPPSRAMAVPAPMRGRWSATGLPPMPIATLRRQIPKSRRGG